MLIIYTILMKNNLIEAVGKDIEIPQEAEIISAKGLFIYPGMIDGKEMNLFTRYEELLEKYKK